MAQFKIELMVAIYVWAGQPGRGPDVYALTWANPLLETRSITVCDGRVIFVSNRNKFKTNLGYGRFVPRFLPNDLGRLLVAYVAQLLPFERALQGSVYLKQTSFAGLGGDGESDSRLGTRLFYGYDKANGLLLPIK